jgi:hypothetical protein
MRVHLKGVCWRLDTEKSPSPWVRCDDDTIEAPHDLYPTLYRLAQRKNAVKAGKKLPGRKKKAAGKRVPEQVRACATLEEAKAAFPHLKEETIDRYYRGR